MAVIYEDQPDGSVKAYSDQHKKIFGGFPEAEYDVVYDPKDAHRTYIETDHWIDSIPKPTCKIFSRLYLEMAIARLGLIDQFDALLKGIELAPGYTAYRAFERANDISEDFPGFAGYVEQIRQALGLTMEQVQAVLDEAEMKNEVI